ncbi:helix-turn-helix domain-containing protein [Brasilonema bromeliae]|uniref:LuxR family transcriptional regulator n=1 Tax=Brasilonema bromeliae SPC951 TaxID=385972 RepID=A0ABX1P9E8_9CYAN|nr:helix-turn-helix transcriptional regulator [Brasilonema bromeliae]NMG20195.1 LuxR family transcriptional regulator [Brasilonema bromeliae SPC951]
MNQQEFEKIFEHLSPRRKEVLRRILAGETDAVIAKAMGIGESTVRKYIERICQEFGLENEHSDGRRYKRSDLVALFAKYKPELLQQRAFTSTNLSENFLLQLFSANIPVQEYLEKQLQLSDDEEKTQTAKSLNKIGHHDYLNGDFKSAVCYLKWAITFNPDFAEAHYNLGAAYEKLEELSSAYHHYEIAMKYSNRAADAAINNLARLSILKGNSAAAVEMIQPILSRVQDSMVKASLHKNLGWAYFEQKLYKQAKKHLLMSLKLDSDRPLTHCLLAKVQEAQGEKQSALESWKDCLKSDYDNQQLKGQDCKLPELNFWQLEARRVLDDEIDLGN